MNRQENNRNAGIMFALLSPLVIWFALIVAECYEDGLKLFDLLERVTLSVNSPTKIYINQYSLKFVFFALFAYAMAIGLYFTSITNSRPGEEHGSAAWGSISAAAQKYTDKKESMNNLILSKRLRLSLNAKSHRRNLNVLVVGGSGAGKTRFYAKPSAPVRAV